MGSSFLASWCTPAQCQIRSGRRLAGGRGLSRQLFGPTSAATHEHQEEMVVGVPCEDGNADSSSASAEPSGVDRRRDISSPHLSRIMESCYCRSRCVAGPVRPVHPIRRLFVTSDETLYRLWNS